MPAHLTDSGRLWARLHRILVEDNRLRWSGSISGQRVSGLHNRTNRPTLQWRDLSSGAGSWQLALFLFCARGGGALVWTNTSRNVRAARVVDLCPGRSRAVRDPDRELHTILHAWSARICFEF